MKYYEIWFYYYGEDDERTDFGNEFTFYVKTEKEINTMDEMKDHLKEEFPVVEGEFAVRMNYVPEEDMQHMTKFFEIPAEEFTSGCGVKA